MQTHIEVTNNYNSLMIPTQPISKLISNLIIDENLSAREICIIFVDDVFLKTLHKDYLNDDTFTDVMTFNLSDDNHVEGEIYISVDRAKIHANSFAVSLEQELFRLIIHGILHLKGYDDQTKAEQKVMRQKEELYLDKYQNLVLAFFD